MAGCEGSLGSNGMAWKVYLELDFHVVTGQSALQRTHDSSVADEHIQVIRCLNSFCALFDVFNASKVELHTADLHGVMDVRCSAALTAGNHVMQSDATKKLSLWIPCLECSYLKWYACLTMTRVGVQSLRDPLGCRLCALKGARSYHDIRSLFGERFSRVFTDTGRPAGDQHRFTSGAVYVRRRLRADGRCCDVSENVIKHFDYT